MAKQSGHIYLIIGASKLGAAIAMMRAKEGRYVTILDKKEDAKFKLGDNFLGSFVVGDATLKTTLEDVNVKKAKEIVIVTESDDTNIFLANMLNVLYDKEDIIIRLKDSTKQEILTSKNIKVINPFLESYYEYENVSNRENK